jgi:alpha-1,6-mannosyltransferase
MRRASERREDVTWYRYCADPKRLAEFYSAADLFIHAGKVETYGLTVLESQACGTPVVALRGGGTDALNQAGEDFLAPRPHSTAFAETIRAVRPQLSDELRKTIRRKVAGTFEVRKNFERQFDIYDRVLQAHAVKQRQPVNGELASPPASNGRVVRQAGGGPQSRASSERVSKPSPRQEKTPL